VIKDEEEFFIVQNDVDFANKEANSKRLSFVGYGRQTIFVVSCGGRYGSIRYGEDELQGLGRYINAHSA
jgi:hypothetical protein